MPLIFDFHSFTIVHAPSIDFTQAAAVFRLARRASNDLGAIIPDPKMKAIAQESHGWQTCRTLYAEVR
jgi:hypothetical protein